MNIFNSVSVKPPKRNKFNLSHQNKLTCEMGKLIPVLMEPVIPGDRFKISSQSLVRFAPLIAPIMSDIDVYMHFFFVPNRLIWKDWEGFITGSLNGKKLESSELPKTPRIGFTKDQMLEYFKPGSLSDYLDFQSFTKSNDFTRKVYFDELPFRAYQRCYFDYYRDENLIDFDDFSLIRDTSGDNDFIDSSRQQELLKLRTRAWKKDYFTSALPWPQKGDDVMLPLGGADIVPNGTYDSAVLKDKNPVLGSFMAFNAGSTILGGEGAMKNFNYVGQNNNSSFDGQIVTPSEEYRPFGINPNRYGVDADEIARMLRTGDIGTTTINDLRRAFAAQRFLERRAKGGSRYIEQNLAFFGVKSSDARLQRAEFIGGTKQPVVISQVLQTSQSTSTSPQANPAGNAVSVGGNFVCDKFCEEYGFIVGIMSIMPKAEYMQGIPKKYLKTDPYEYYWPQFAKIGEQPILQKELNYRPWQINNETATFGYTPRYAEYRFIPNRVHGDFKDTLKMWTLARDFGDQGVFLNQSFIECNPDTRIYAVEDSDFNHCWVQINFDIKALRPITKYGEAN